MNRKIPIILAMIILLTGAVSVSSQFLKPDEKTDTVADKSKPRKKDEKKVYPDQIAYNIKAVRDPDKNNSVKITWEVNSASKHEFIVGRYSEKMDSPDKALKSSSVEIAPGSAKGVVFDHNLKNGSYFYVVLAKDSIRKREIELYPDVNFTDNAVVIGDEVKSSMTAETAGAGSVLVKWQKGGSAGTVYFLYRGRDVLNSRERLAAASKITEVRDADQYTDRGITASGTYFYAVTAKTQDKDEEFIFTPDVTFTSKGISVAVEEKKTSAVSGITAEPAEDGIVVRWKTERSGTPVKGFALYRHTSVINSYDSLTKAKHIATLPADALHYTDKGSANGAAYYAVIVKYADDSVDLEMRNGVNYTSAPAKFSGGVKKESNVKAVYKNGRIIISWRVPDDSNAESDIYIFKTWRLPKRYSDISRKDIIGRADITSGRFIYKPPSEGYFYYGILPEDFRENPDQKLNRGSELSSSTVGIDGDADGIDEVLERTFFKRKYHIAIKELEIISRYSDNERVKAKAFLFIGRSYIELGKYHKALRYLIRDEVEKYYPDEAKFWRDFAYLRL